MIVKKPRPLRLLCMNVCGMFGTGFSSRRISVGRALGRFDADLIAVQELFTEADARKVDQGISLPHRFRHRRLGMLAGGLALYSRRPLAEARFIGFKEQGAWYRLSLLARLNQKGFIFARWENPRLGIINTHLLANYAKKYERGAYLRWQRRQAEELIGFIARLDPSLPLIVLGDFNVPPENQIYRRLCSIGLVDAMEGSRRPSMVSREEIDLGILAPNETLRVDFVFLRPGVGAKPGLKCSYVLDKEGLSDHRGLLAELSLD